MNSQILRAGPFGSSSNSFINEPVSAGASVVPINAARENVAKWGWKYYAETYRAFGAGTEITTREYEDAGNPDFIDESATATTSGGNSSAHIEVRWRYQARQDHTFTITYDLTSEVTSGSGVDGTYVSLEAWVDGVKEVDLLAGDPNSSPGASSETLSGTVDITLSDTNGAAPKLVQIRAEGAIAEIGSADTEVDLNISIS